MRKPVGITVPYRAPEFNEFERRSKVKQTLITNKREWVGLTDDEMLMIYGQNHEGKKYNLGRMVQRALKEKNA